MIDICPLRMLPRVQEYIIFFVKNLILYKEAQILFEIQIHRERDHVDSFGDTEAFYLFDFEGRLLNFQQKLHWRLAKAWLVVEVHSDLHPIVFQMTPTEQESVITNTIEDIPFHTIEDAIEGNILLSTSLTFGRETNRKCLRSSTVETY
jgi:hypothetical protein